MTGQEIMDAWEKFRAMPETQKAIALAAQRGNQEHFRVWMRQAFINGIDACESKWREGMKELVEEIGGGEFQ